MRGAAMHESSDAPNSDAVVQSGFVPELGDAADSSTAQLAACKDTRDETAKQLFEFPSVR